MSLTSARVGTARVCMLSSIWVTTIKGTPAARQAAESCFWQRGSSHRGMALPRSPRAMTTSSTSGKNSGSACTPARFSILARIFSCGAPASASACRRLRMSAAPRTKGSMTPVTPQSAAMARFSLSSAVRVGIWMSAPGAARLLRLCSTPPRITVHTRASGSAVSTRASSLPSSSSNSCPGCTPCTSAVGQGMPCTPRRTVCPAVRDSGCGRRPMRNSGPCKSMSSFLTPALCSITSQSLCAASGP